MPVGWASAAWSMRSTVTSTSMTPPATPRSARSGVRSSEVAVPAVAGSPHTTGPAGGAHRADRRARVRPGAARRGAEDPAGSPGLSVELHGLRLRAVALAALRDVLGARRPVAGGGGARDEPVSFPAGGGTAAGRRGAGGVDVPDLPAAASVQPAAGAVLPAPQPVAEPPEAAPRRACASGRPTSPAATPPCPAPPWRRRWPTASPSPTRSAPYVAGGAALYRATHPTASPQTVNAALRTRAVSTGPGRRRTGTPSRRASSGCPRVWPVLTSRQRGSPRHPPRCAAARQTGSPRLISHPRGPPRWPPSDGPTNGARAVRHTPRRCRSGRPSAARPC